MFFLRNVFPHIVSTETLLFFNFGNCRKFTYVVATNFNFLPNKLNFAAETIQGRQPFKGRNCMRKYGILTN